MKIEPGTRIGPYEIVGLLGVGGMGEVYRARDERLQRDVALKLVTEGSGAPGGDADRMRRLQKEAQAASQLNHPNIVGVFDVGTHEDRTYVVTELLLGESLREVGRRGPMPWRTALGLSRYDLATGKLDPWRTLAPVDPAGVLTLGRISVARDGEVYVYESYRLLSDLYVIENLR